MASTRAPKAPALVKTVKAASAATAPLPRLRAAARAAADLAYAPYSRFQVGAAIWTDAGLFTGCNVENASYGLCNCAERTAIFSAVAAGARRLFCVAVFTPTSLPTMPCGACRQVIHEFGPEALVLSNCAGPDEINTVIHALLPGAFGPADLGIDPADKTLQRAPKRAVKRSNKTS
jgi:cytidine deaminase